jgi:hypothetical protein|tara:strand:+ start:786 stop:1097 length:312 start_codon:yes stop_codon:yes gene_type:complete
MQDHAMHGIMDPLAQTASALAVQSGLIMQQITQHAMDIPVQQEKNAPEVLAKHPHQRQHQLQLLYLPLHPAFQVLPNHVVVRVHLAVMDACVPMIHVVKMKTL